MFLYCFTWSSNQLLNLNIFSFLFLHTFHLSTRFVSVLTLKSSTIHWLTCFRVSSGLFRVLFWMIWMLVTVHKLWHVPYASRISTYRTVFTERHFSVSMEWGKSSSYAFLMTYHKTLIKKTFLTVRPEKVTRRKKRRKKTRMAIAKLLALNANAKTFRNYFPHRGADFRDSKYFFFSWIWLLSLTVTLSENP